MENRTYSDILKDPQWQRKRLEVMQRADFSCQACGSKIETLHIHHGLYRFGVAPWDFPDDTLWCLCETCHTVYGEQLLDLRFEIGRTNPKDYGRAMCAIARAKDGDLNDATFQKYLKNFENMEAERRSTL